MQIDLSHPIETGMPTYPGDPSVHIAPSATYSQDGYRVATVEMGSHTGTHVDAPSHVLESGRTLDAYPLERFAFDAIRVDCTDLAERDPIAAEAVPDDDADLAVFSTGWSTHWGTERYLDHPYLTPEAAAVCAERGYAVGTDTLSPDPTPTNNQNQSEPDDMRAHHTLLSTDNLILENLTNLGELPHRFELRAYPIPFEGDGAPVRAIGVVK